MGLLGNENKWGFWQIVPFASVILIIPIFAFVTYDLRHSRACALLPDSLDESPMQNKSAKLADPANFREDMAEKNISGDEIAMLEQRLATRRWFHVLETVCFLGLSGVALTIPVIVNML